MFLVFWTVVALVAVLVFRNTRYAVRHYLSDRKRLIFTLYMAFLVAFGYLVITLTRRTVEFVHVARLPETSLADF